MKTALSQIRSIAIAKANRLQCAASHLDILRPAFAEWEAGEIYVCKKTATYRYRHGDRSKSVAPWSKTAQAIFTTPAAFAFAAMVLAEESEMPKLLTANPVQTGRANIIQMSVAA